MSEEALRARAVEVALSYQGTQYRWGGKSPLGVDCSGLTFMAWFFCGVSLYRDARLVDGFPARPIPFEARKPGDLLYFPGHIALYLGNDRYIHSTARAGSDGVVINSLDPAAPDYRADLRESCTPWEVCSRWRRGAGVGTRPYRWCVSPWGRSLGPPPLS